MIHSTFKFLKNQLNEYFNLKLGNEVGADQDMIQYMKSVQPESITFKDKVVTPLLINLKEETRFRADEPFSRITRNGKGRQENPDIRLNLYILFVSRFDDSYEEALMRLSLLIQYFQANRIFTQERYPSLSPEIDRLVMELITLPFSEQNEVWNALKGPYLPSVLYKVSMLVFRDQEQLAQSTNVMEIENRYVRK